jgi:hypothetical protein
MSNLLPKGKLAATRVNPKRLLLYSLPKVGKTKALSELDSCLVLDTEGGSEMYECARTRINSCEDIDALVAEIITHGKENGGKYPYTYIALDTVDMLEEFAERKATKDYKNSVIGKSFMGSSILDLPQGGGYYYIRKVVQEYLDKLERVCKYFVIVAHVKEKLLMKAGVEVTSRDISLAGKLASIVCASCDAIGYMSRDTISNGQMMVNFQTFDNAVMGARCEHLKGQSFPFDWNKIYIENKVDNK